MQLAWICPFIVTSILLCYYTPCQTQSPTIYISFLRNEWSSTKPWWLSIWGGGLMTMSADNPALYQEYRNFLQQNFHHPQLGVMVPGRQFIRGEWVWSKSYNLAKGVCIHFLMYIILNMYSFIPSNSHLETESPFPSKLTDWGKSSARLRGTI